PPRREGASTPESQIWADMFEDTDDPIAAIGPDYRLIALNGAYRSEFQRLFGVDVAIGDSLADALAHMPLARDASIYMWSRALQGEVIDVPRTRDADAEGSYFDIKFRPLYDRQGNAIGAYQYSRNVTERVRAQHRLREAREALVRAQKMEALGQLTGGVAHDFNNLLQVVSGNLQLLKKDVAGNERAERRVENALAGVSRGAKLAAQLLAFGRRQPLAPKVVNLGRALRGMDDMLRRTLGGQIELETVVSGGLWNTSVDPNQFESAILNLALNARDATVAGGKITIEAGNAFLDDAYARQHEEVVAGQYVMVAVTDTGSGMTAQVRERAFEPFYSTKAEGKGTGLGLSMVFGVVKQSGGHIKIYSEVGQGTTIRLYLPRSQQGEDALAPMQPAAVQGGNETVLVVEDDEDVRETASSMLSELGYRVLEAPEASTALAIVEGGASIDLLFTDVVMPGPLASTELARLARHRISRLAVLFTSGYTENAIVHGGRLDPGVDLLAKPYTREALALKLRQVLQNRA
ncbi:MAG TPA: ATP-binding protein, partial [Chloroflexota bacterium]